MTYKYAYRSSDGQRHEASMEAPSRDEVFAALRAQGIKAIKVVAADGTKANGEVHGVRKRIVVLGAVCLLLGAIGAGILSFRAGESSNARGTNHEARSTPISVARHQIYGDPVIVDEIEHGRTETWLTNRLDQILAWFAQPGKLMCPKNTDLRRAAETFARELSPLMSGRDGVPPPSAACEQPSEARQPKAARPPYQTIAPTDPREVRELKQIVNGLREELAAYLANGNGTPRSYWRRLVQRTQQEAQIYERTRRELENETNPAVFEQKNQALQTLGLRTIPNAKADEG